MDRVSERERKVAPSVCARALDGASANSVDAKMVALQCLWGLMDWFVLLQDIVHVYMDEQVAGHAACHTLQHDDP